MPSQPVVLYADNFSGDPIGSFPGGWNGGGSQVIADPLGFYYHVVSMGANHIWQNLNHLYSSATVYFGFCLDSQTEGVYVYSFANSGPLDNGIDTTRIVDLVIEPDMTLSIVGFGGVIVGNTGVNVPPGTINPDGWNYIQFSVQLSTFTRSDSVLCMAVTCDLGINGTSYNTAAYKALPALPVASMYYQAATFNWWLFNAPNINGGPIANVYLCEYSELNVFPFDFVGSPPVYTVGTSNLKISQGYLEVCEDPDIGDLSETNLRVTQGFIEVVELPLIQANPLKEFPNLRISQVFIELMTEGETPISAQGSRVYEA